MNTTIYLLNLPLDIEYKHTYYFSTANEQATYFINKAVITLENYNYQRKNDKVRINLSIDQVKRCNYLMYKNADYQNKWMYCFIKDFKFISDGLTEITIETDVLQTWMFAIKVGKSFVEREHTNDDTIGKHTIPENLDTGDYVSADVEPSMPVKFGIAECIPVLAVSELTALTESHYRSINERIPNGTYFIGCEDINTLKGFINHYDSLGKADAIQYIFVAPKSFFGSNNWIENTLELVSGEITGKYNCVLIYDFYQYIKLGISKNIKDYTPRNNKLFTYPYNFLQVSNNSGSVVNYNWEDFIVSNSEEDGNYIEFETIGCLTPGCQFKLYPMNYKGFERNYDEGINAGKLPIGSWNSDVYINWLTQNAVNNPVSLISSMGSIIGGAVLLATGGGAMAGAGMIVGGLAGITNQVGQHYQRDLQPNQVRGNTNNGDVNYLNNLIGFNFKRISIKKEYASIIDNYFDMFGYKVNELKIPNTNHRKCYWYTKTIDANISLKNVDAQLPMDDLKKIVDIYNNGITFWRTTTGFREYDTDNSIL